MGSLQAMRIGVAITFAFGVFLGLWVYGDLDSVAFWGQHGIDQVAHETAFELATIALAILVGFVVRRRWVLTALLGPLLCLGYAQINGERGFDGAAPLTSPSGISDIFWFGLFLLLGVGLGRAWERWRRGTRSGSGGQIGLSRSGPK
jgi:hypothetical protein